MAVKRNTLSRFVKDFDELLSVDKNAIRQWNILTLGVLGDAQSRSPVASGALEGSGSNLRAKIGPNGVESAVVFKVPYARSLNREKSDIRLKETGEISYYVNGTKVTKRRKGEKGFLNKAVRSFRRDFIKASKDAVSKSFLGI